MMTGPVLRAGAWPAVAGVVGVAVVAVVAACVARTRTRTRTGEPGPAAGTAVVLVLVLMAPSLVPHVARWIRTFPASGGGLTVGCPTG
jgi:hypothetical protein